MKKNILISLAIIALLFVVIYLLAWMYGEDEVVIYDTPVSPDSTIVHEQNTPADLAAADPSVADPTADTLVLAKDGQRLPVQNLIHLSDTKQHQPYFFEIATDPSHESLFAIYFFTGTGQLMIDLYSEPLEEIRLLAEQALTAKLNLSTAEICFLDIDVRTNQYVNTYYSGRNLGLSFCPGSERLR